MIPCSVEGILWSKGQAKVTALPSPKRVRAGRYKIFSDIPAYRQAGLSDRYKFEQRLRDYLKVFTLVDRVYQI